MYVQGVTSRVFVSEGHANELYMEIDWDQLRKRAEDGDPEAQFALAEGYREGLVPPPKKGFFGKVTIELPIQDGAIQCTVCRVERMQR